MRLDQYLALNNYYGSREKAQDAIKKGIVKVNGKVINKPSFQVENEVLIELTEELLAYVSWGGMKLKRAIDYFNLDFKDKVVLDIGASTGGFTDCALQHGAKLVYAVDVGKNQLAEKLRKDKRVISLEELNICDFETDVNFDYLVMDVSFVSITKIIPDLLKFLKEDTKLICLFKPQFEVGKIKIKNGVIKDPKIHYEVCDLLIKYLEGLGLYVNNLTYSTQVGKMGNLEYLALVSRKNYHEKYDLKEVINLSHRM